MTIEVRQETLRGMPVFTCDSPLGRTAATLTFRVGRADEHLAISGVTHLVEHLAFKRVGQRPHFVNGQVTSRFCSFLVDSTDPGDVASFLESIVQGLTDDVGDDVEKERRVLRTEAGSRGSVGTAGVCLAERYGAIGPGVLGYEEFGLRRLANDEIKEWRDRWFVADNAALWIVGSLPDLHLELPRGPVPGIATLRPRSLDLPGYVTVKGPHVGASLVAPKSDPATVAINVLGTRLTATLRHDLGISYSVDVAGDDLDENDSHAWLSADALPEQVSAVAHALLSEAERLAQEGCKQEELDHYLRRIRDMLDSPSGPMIVVDRMAHRTLMGFGARQPETMLRAVEEVTPGQVAASLGEMLPTAIVALPHPVGPVEGRMARLPVSSPSEVTGEQVSSNVSGRRLTVGDDGVTVSAADSDFRVTVRYSECEAVLSWSDGKRTLIGADGFFVVIDPAEWPGGERITEQVLSRIPDLVRVAMDGPGPEMPRPPSPSPATPPPKSSSRASGSSTKLGDLAIRWGWIAVLALGWLGVVAGHGMTQIGGLILIVLAVATRLVYVQRLRRRSRRPRQRKPETGV